MIRAKLLEKLVTRSRKNVYNVFDVFSWPADLPQDRYWLAPELLTVSGTEFCEAEETRLVALSRCETKNLFSFFARGEADLMQTVIAAGTREEFAAYFDYFIHFIDEENKHMWFFAEFCRRYCGGLYPIRKIVTAGAFTDDVEQFLGFMRILVFEELGDFINVRVAADERVPGLLRQIHSRHHEDEAGHISMGWDVGRHLLMKLRARHPDDELKKVRQYLGNYMSWTVQNLYNPMAYQDAGFSDPYEVRAQLQEHPARKLAHQRILHRANERLNRLWDTPSA